MKAGAISADGLPHRLDALDGLRGIAILLVLAHQLLILEEPPSHAVRVVGYLLNFGWAGVQLFFVLSGFLITRVLLDMQAASNYYRAFFARRALRIFPLYYGMLIVFFVVWPALGRPPAGLQAEDSLWYWLYLQNWSVPLGTGHASLPHLWSLAVEEQFYLFWPFIVRRQTPQRLLLVCLGVAAASVLYRYVLYAAGLPPQFNYMTTPARLDALAFGAALAAALRIPGVTQWLAGRRRHLAWVTVAIALAGAFATHGYPVETPRGQVLGYALLGVVFALWIALAATGERDRWGWQPLNWRLLRAFGTYSYAIYLFHKPLHDLVGKPVLRALGIASTDNLLIAIAYMSVGTCMLFIAGWLSYRVFESPILALKARFRPHGIASATDEKKPRVAPGPVG